jgi:shikimate kinase
MADNIYLVGMMGSGKTAVAKLLAERLGRKVIDLDDAIVASQGMSVNEIFASKGEAFFREVEHAELRKASFARSAVVATGGGIVINDENMIVMKETGVMIYIKASVDALFSHLKEDSSRPLLKVADPKAKLKMLLDERRAQYEKADFVLETSALGPQAIAENVIEIINKKGKRSRG